MAMYRWWLIFTLSVRCDVIHFKYKHKSDVTKPGIRSAGLYNTKSLVQCAILCSMANKQGFFYEKIAEVCSPDVDIQHCNYNKESAIARKKGRALFLTLKKKNRFSFSLHSLSDTTPMSINSTSELFSVEGPITDVDYHVDTNTVYWITERNAKTIVMRKVGESEKHIKRWPNRKYGILELAIDNINNYFFFMGKYQIKKSKDLKKYHKLPFTLQKLGDKNHMALDPRNRRVFYTVWNSGRDRLNLRYIPYEGRKSGLVYITKEEMRAFLPDPTGLYVFVCLSKLQRIVIKTRSGGKVSPRRSLRHCSLMTGDNRQIFVMTSTHGKLGVTILDVKTFSVQHEMDLSLSNVLEDAHLVVLNM